MNSSLEIISSEGLRGLTYRAIAKHAKVPLGSTTYYFSSIEEIYIAAYKLFAVRADEYIDKLRDESLNILIKYNPISDQDPENKVQFVDELSEIVTDYIYNMVVKEEKYRLIEAAFLHSALMHDDLKCLLRKRKNDFIGFSERWFSLLNLEKPKHEATIFVGLMLQLEQMQLMRDTAEFEHQFVKESISTFFRKLA
nr:TetR family transcriptional regulator [Shewanella corallii]